MLIIDNGRNFIGTAFKKLLKKYNIKHTYTTPYYSLSNGTIKKVNDTLVKKLKIKQIENNRRKLNTLLPDVVDLYNKTPHDTPYTILPTLWNFFL